MRAHMHPRSTSIGSCLRERLEHQEKFKNPNLDVEVTDLYHPPLVAHGNGNGNWIDPDQSPIWKGKREQRLIHWEMYGSYGTAGLMIPPESFDPSHGDTEAGGMERSDGYPPREINVSISTSTITVAVGDNSLAFNRDDRMFLVGETAYYLRTAHGFDPRSKRLEYNVFDDESVEIHLIKMVNRGYSSAELPSSVTKLREGSCGVVRKWEDARERRNGVCMFRSDFGKPQKRGNVDGGWEHREPDQVQAVPEIR
ncbi:hypothetical protein K438DRAFT_1769287 [Mycena galopus ATCC 62051]|nr:hypothetical protein K438DRAFT_1769287 [Mycena galopus ATCC 62051]